MNSTQDFFLFPLGKDRLFGIPLGGNYSGLGGIAANRAGRAGGVKGVLCASGRDMYR